MFNAISRIAALVVGVSLTIGLVNAEPVPAAPGSPLRGTWEIQGNPDPTCNVPPFVNLSSISREGRIINVDPAVGTGVGESYRTGPNTFAAGFFGFLDDNGTTLTYEVQGMLSLVDASHFTGSFTAFISDLGGNVLCTYGGTLDGYRLVVPVN